MLRKINPWVIVRGHYKTFYDDRTEQSKPTDFAIVICLPLIVAGVPFVTGAALTSTSGLLAAVSAMGGLLFFLLVFVLEKAADTAAASEDLALIDSRILRRVKVLQELTANVSYSVLITIAATVVLMVGEFIPADGIAPLPGEAFTVPRQPAWLTALALALVTHLVITLLMVLKRVFNLTERELDLAKVPLSRR